jgi:threonine/homoserine efflux transporter RhtA
MNAFLLKVRDGTGNNFEIGFFFAEAYNGTDFAIYAVFGEKVDLFEGHFMVAIGTFIGRSMTHEVDQ